MSQAVRIQQGRPRGGVPLRGLRPRHAAHALASALLTVLAALCVQPGGAFAFGVAKWEAGTCTQRACTASATEGLYTQAAGHPGFGVADFRLQTSSGVLEAPEGRVKDVRVDLPPGLAIDPEAVEQCTEAQLERSACPAGSRVGEDVASGVAALTSTTEAFPIYDMQPRPGEPARLAIEARSLTLSLLGLGGVLYLEGGVSWHREQALAGGEASEVGSGDYHDYFKISDIPKAPALVESRLIFWGIPHEHDPAAPDRAFVTMPSACEGPETTWLHVDSYEDPGHYLAYRSTTPVGLSGCGGLAIDPTISLMPRPSAADAPDGAQISLSFPAASEPPASTSPPAVRTIAIALPEGMTLDPSAANGLQTCTGAEVGLGTGDPVSCPAGSVLGTASMRAPGIGGGSLTGHVYLASPPSGAPTSGGEYRIFVALQDPGAGVGARLEGHLRADPSSGRLTATFSDLPPVPFESFTLTFTEGPDAPLANPLTCGPASVQASLTAYSEPTLASSTSGGLRIGGAGCPASPPFSIAQSATAQPSAAGADTSLTLTFTRAEGEQYLAALTAALPKGLLGIIPSVPRCGRAAAADGGCPAASELGAASMAVGSGPDPYRLTGTVFLTGPYGGAPYGLSIVIPAEHVGPFDYGTVVIRAAVEFDRLTARLIVRSSLPSMVEGVPLRLRSLSIAIDRRGFLVGPTSCGALATSTSFVSTFGASASASTPLQASGCASLPFSPTLSVDTGAASSRNRGASLDVRLSEPPGQARVRSVAVTLPRRFIVRLGALEHACARATFAADPSSCPGGSVVGEASVQTPTLPGTMRGPAYLVSHGSAFPDLDLVLSADGVSFTLIGETSVTKGRTHARFASLPDVPISRFDLSLPTGPNALFAVNRDLCDGAMRMPSAIVAQSGAKTLRRIALTVRGCGLRILSRRVRGDQVVLSLRVRSSGLLQIGGGALRRIRRHLAAGRTARVVARLSRQGMRALRRRGRLKVRLRVRFDPGGDGGHAANAAVTAVLRA